MNDSAIAELARLSVLGYEHVDALEETERKRLEAEGYRLVTGGQTGPQNDDGRSDWQVNDFRTGEHLTSGHGTYAEYSEAIDHEESVRGEHWYEVSNIWHDLEMPVAECPHADGIPPSLAEVIHTWVAEGDPEDVAAFTGLPLARIQALG